MTQNLYQVGKMIKINMINIFGNKLVLAPAKCVVVPSGSRRWQR